MEEASASVLLVGEAVGVADGKGGSGGKKLFLKCGKYTVAVGAFFRNKIGRQKTQSCYTQGKRSIYAFEMFRKEEGRNGEGAEAAN